MALVASPMQSVAQGRELLLIPPTFVVSAWAGSGKLQLDSRDEAAVLHPRQGC